METTTLLAFLGAVLLAYVVPGPDWFVVLRHAAGGRRPGWLAALGVQCGLLVHMTAAAVGVSAVLLASAEVFTVLKLLGAAYLVHLGLRSLRSARRIHRVGVGATDGGAGSGAELTGAQVWRQSFVANLLNPKAALFFVAVLPQFLDPGLPVAAQVLALGTLDIVLGLVWWGVFVLGVGRAGGLLRSRRGRIAVEGVSGVALVGLGGALATTRPSRA